MKRSHKKSTKVRVNLGGGQKTILGFLNLDIIPMPEVDIVCDLNQGIPLESNTVSKIHAFNILEHLENTVKVMEEIYRVCKDGAIIKIKTPYFKSIGAFKDPTHRSFFTEGTFYYFNQRERKIRNLPNYNIKANFKIENISYIWASPWIGRLPFKKILMKYCWNIARTIYYELTVIK